MPGNDIELIEFQDAFRVGDLFGHHSLSEWLGHALHVVFAESESCCGPSVRKVESHEAKVRNPYV